MSTDQIKRVAYLTKFGMSKDQDQPTLMGDNNKMEDVVQEGDPIIFMARAGTMVVALMIG
eukprot:12422073-Ditylum_brightwellii.AAC.1